MLDKDKPYGECGSNIYGWKFTQNGKYYRKNGEEIDKEGKPVEADTVSKPAGAPPEDVKAKAIPKPRGRRKSAVTARIGANK